MLETEDLILAPARQTDWQDMYENVWSRPESARYMAWKVTESPEQARERMARTIAWEQSHEGCMLVYLKRTGRAIGFAGAQEIGPGEWEECGICLGPDFVGRGYGGQILQALMDDSRARGGRYFYYTSRDTNRASLALARSRGFTPFCARAGRDERDGGVYVSLTLRRKL